MANQEQEVSVDAGVSDSELFSDAFGSSKEPVTAEPPTETVTSTDGAGEVSAEAQPEPETAGRERDERGRFKAKGDTQEQPAEAEPQKQETAEAAAQDEPEPEQPPSKDDDAKGMVPSWRAREYREERDAERNARLQAEQKATALEQQAQQAFAAIQQLQHQIQQLQNPPKPQEQAPVPNLFEDPDAFVGTLDQRFAQLEKSFQRQRQQDRLEMNLAMTHRQHPEEFPEALQAFYQAAETDKSLQHRVFASADQGGSILAWHKEQKTLKEIGTDPNAYVQTKLEEALKDPAFLARALEAAKAQASGQPQATPAQAQATRPNTVVKRPPSLSGVPGGASAHAGVTGSGDSDRDLFNEALFSR